MFKGKKKMLTKGAKGKKEILEKGRSRYFNERQMKAKAR